MHYVEYKANLRNATLDLPGVNPVILSVSAHESDEDDFFFVSDRDYKSVFVVTHVKRSC